MDERLALSLAAGLVVAVAAWLLLAEGARETARTRRALGLPAAPVGPAMPRPSVTGALSRLGDLVPPAPFEALGGGVAIGPGADRDRLARGIGLALALPVLALALDAALWLLALPALPRLARFLVEQAARRRERRRKRELERDVTAALDVFVLALEAGLPFESAVGAYIGTVESVLAGELATAARELEVGYRRREVLDRLASRTSSTSLAALASTVRLAEEFGTPLASALRSLALDTRAHRRQRLQEAALRAPITMLLPTAAFILVPIFAIILGPIAIRVFSGTLF